MSQDPLPGELFRLYVNYYRAVECLRLALRMVTLIEETEDALRRLRNGRESRTVKSWAEAERLDCEETRDLLDVLGRVQGREKTVARLLRALRHSLEELPLPEETEAEAFCDVLEGTLQPAVRHGRGRIDSSQLSALRTTFKGTGFNPRVIEGGPS